MSDNSDLIKGMVPPKLVKPANPKPGGGHRPPKMPSPKPTPKPKE